MTSTMEPNLQTAASNKTSCAVTLRAAAGRARLSRPRRAGRLQPAADLRQVESGSSDTRTENW